MKTFKVLLISLLLLAVLSNCNLPIISSLPASTADQNPVGPFATRTLQVDPSRTKVAATRTPTYTAPTMTAAPIPTSISSNTPFWSVYNYTCELADGGATMTMNLTWSDRSYTEEGYRVYRDKQVIATLVPNSTAYVDITFVAAGKTLSYSVEAFNKDWKLSTSTITYACEQ